MSIADRGVLLGDAPTQALTGWMSTELRVTRRRRPTSCLRRPTTNGAMDNNVMFYSRW